MFVDYLTLLLINMIAGLATLVIYVVKGLDDPNQSKWAPAFALPGLIALVIGLHLALTWPLPGPYNAAFGDLTVLFGILFLGAAFAIAKGWDLLPLGIYAFFAGLAAVLVGVRIIHLGLTSQPILSGLGFILTGLGGIFAAPVLYCRSNKLLRYLGAAVLTVAVLLWALTGYLGYWMHLESFAKWMPPTMR